MKKTNVIEFIKSYDAPPFDTKDPYYLREPWNKFGGVSSGIYMKWCWFRTEIIDDMASDIEVEKALREITNQFETTYKKMDKLEAGDVFFRNQEINVCIDNANSGYVWITTPEYYNQQMDYSYTSAYPEKIEDEYVQVIGNMRITKGVNI